MSIWNTYRNRLAIALTMLGVLAFASPLAASAQVDVGACGTYSSQDEAQADLDANPDLVTDLDPDGNGVACEGFDSPGTGSPDVGACGVYSSQEEAQADLDANPDLAETLDPEGTGVACEGFDAGDDDDANADDSADDSEGDEAVSALPSTGSGPAMTAGDRLVPVAGALALAALTLTMGLRTHSGQSSTCR
jgi:hypothetical protein